MISKIISGGQSGVDIGALDAAMDLGFECGGYCPKGRQSENGTIDEKYPLIETSSYGYKERTKKNVIESDFTLIICESNLTAGSLLTKKLCIENSRPFYIIYFRKYKKEDYDKLVIDIVHELHSHLIDRALELNVAGTRASNWIGGYDFSYMIVSKIIQASIDSKR